MERKLSNEYIKEVLKNINPRVRKFFGNMIELHTGIDPAKANGLNLRGSIDFLKHVWGICLDWGNQRMDYIDRSVQQLDDFLTSFNSENEIHNLDIFLKKLEGHWDRLLSIKPNTSGSQDEVRRLTELLTDFHSVRIKTAALIMRFICLDCNFFEIDKSKLIPPLDRVNYRMCEQLLGRKYILEKLGNIRGTFSEEATMTFNNIGKNILGEDKILIDNLWFVGHFYHDGTNCQIRESAKIIEFPYLRQIDLLESCPFLEYGCER